MEPTQIHPAAAEAAAIDQEKAFRELTRAADIAVTDSPNTMESRVQEDGTVIESAYSASRSLQRSTSPDGIVSYNYSEGGLTGTRNWEWTASKPVVNTHDVLPSGNDNAHDLDTGAVAKLTTTLGETFPQFTRKQKLARFAGTVTRRNSK